MTGLTHEPTPLYEMAEQCGCITPPQSEMPEDDDWAWAAWDAGHPAGIGDDRERVCLDTELRTVCLACTAIAREDFELADDAYIDIWDCIHTPAVTE